MEAMTFERTAFKKALSFERGADIKTTLRIGELEGLRIKLEELRKHPAVSFMHTYTQSVMNEVNKDIKILSLIVDFKRTDEKYNHIDEFLSKYLDKRFFNGAHIEDDSKIEGASFNLSDLRKEPTYFTIMLFIHPDYFDKFPDIRPIY